MNQGVLLEDPVNQRVLLENLVNQRVLLENPVNQRVLSDNPVHQRVLYGEPTDSLGFPREPTEISESAGSLSCNREPADSPISAQKQRNLRNGAVNESPEVAHSTKSQT